MSSSKSDNGDTVQIVEHTEEVKHLTVTTAVVIDTTKLKSPDSAKRSINRSKSCDSSKVMEICKTQNIEGDCNINELVYEARPQLDGNNDTGNPEYNN